MLWDDDYEKILRGSLKFLKPDQALEPDAELSALGLDSLEMVGLMASLEDHYGIVFPDEDLTVQTFRTPGSLWSVLRGLTSSGA
jgi:acyl carrier protein